jgi:hypothetical protein
MFETIVVLTYTRFSEHSTGKVFLALLYHIIQRQQFENSTQLYVIFVYRLQIFALGLKKIPVVPIPDRPYFLGGGGCGLLPKWRLLSH